MKFSVNGYGYYYCVITPTPGNVPGVTRTARLGVKRLVGHWRLEDTWDDFDGWDYFDRSGYGIDLGLFYGTARWVDGIVGQDAVEMRGNSGWADEFAYGPYIPSKMTDQLSVSFWVNWNGSTEQHQGIVSKRNANEGWGSGSSYWTVFTNDSGDLGFASPGSEIVAWEALQADEQWQYIVAATDGSRGRIYVNGELAAEGAFTLSGNPEATFHLGASIVSEEVHYFNGAMDEVRIYNYSLDSWAVGQAYTTVTGEIVCADPPPAYLDLNQDCVIDIQDMAIFVENWLSSGAYGLFELEQ